jgi:hypothetical protein
MNTESPTNSESPTSSEILKQSLKDSALATEVWLEDQVRSATNALRESTFVKKLSEDRGDVPGWVLVVLMTTGLVTAIWTVAAPRLSAILKNSLDAMNGIR